MPQALLYFIASLLFLTGVLTLIYTLVMLLLTPRKRQPYAVVLALTEENNPAGLLGAALEKRNLCGEANYCHIIAVDLGLREDTREFLQSMYAHNDRLTLCDYQDLHAAIRETLLTPVPQKAKK